MVQDNTKRILNAKKQPKFSSSGAPAEAAEATCATSLTRQLHISALCSFLAGCFSLAYKRNLVRQESIEHDWFFIKHLVMGI
jgi:hypothetical protein